MLVYDNKTGQVLTADIRKPEEHEVAWIRLHKASPEDVKSVLEGIFSCHPLLVEDAMKLNQRPKLDRYKTHVFVTFFAVHRGDFKLQEVAMVLGPNYVITVSQEDIPFFNELEKEFQLKEDEMDHSGEILYRMIDRCVDEYSYAVDYFETQVEKLERIIYRNPSVRVAQDIFRLKRSMNQLRRVFIEEKTVLGVMSHQNLPYISQEKDAYFIDIFDHISRVIDSLDIFRESLSGLLELQMAMKSDRMNEVMKTLTLISSLFLPLTFIVGLYGMNFRIIPELDWTYGYLFVWALMIVVSIGMFIFYKRKKWM